MHRALRSEAVYACAMRHATKRGVSSRDGARQLNVHKDTERKWLAAPKSKTLSGWVGHPPPKNSSDKLRRCARCTACGHKGATIQHPGWGGDVGFVPFPAHLLAATTGDEG
jgi:hypothetical protein